MLRLKNLFTPRALNLPFSKAQTELLELLMGNKSNFDAWQSTQANRKIRFQFFYPTAIDFYYDEFKLFNAFFKRNAKGDLNLHEFKMSETNYETIRCNSWAPFEEVIIEFLTSLEESKKIALFEKRKTLFEYQSLCNKQAEATAPDSNFTKTVASSLSFLKLSQ